MLTFDVEDHFNPRSIEALYVILKILRKYDLKTLFFITGHFAERIGSSPRTLKMLQTHEIGYHSTCHSVRPNIFEYTDLISYHDAYIISLKRETAHVNPLSGDVEGRGGIDVLRDLFPHKTIEAFRAPGFSWSPPHLEALASLGFKYDFSTNLSQVPVYYKGITFYPMPTLIDWEDTPNYYKHLLSSALTKGMTVLDFHPNLFVNQNYWDLFFPKLPPQRSVTQTKILLLKFETLLNVIKFMQKSKLIEASPDVKKSRVELKTSEIDVESVFKQIISWPIMQFNCKPRYLRSHLMAFFGLNEYLK